MKVYKHPVWSDLTITRPDDDDTPLANGWVPVYIKGEAGPEVIVPIYRDTEVVPGFLEPPSPARRR